MKSLNKLTTVIAKIFEVFHWVGAGLFVLCAIFSAFAKDLLYHVTDAAELTQSNISVYGFEVSLVNSTGQFDYTVFTIFCIGAVIIMMLMAMVFRNIYLIVKKSTATTPFQKDNVRMVKEIGIFSIAIPVVGLIMSMVVRLVCGVDAVDTSVSLGGFAIGIIVLCLTQYFAYGVQLQSDVDGLV